ncbi:VanZ family protein [Desulfitobacterium sp. THU1]
MHQLFVPGRSGQIKDVLLDSGGAIVGVVFL